METTDYKVQLENFYGPLDLLLHLVKEDELNIYNIPIARVAEQYVTCLETMKQLDINLAGEFLVMAASLMEIKVKALIPREDDEPEEDDPRFELVRKLIEYKKYKDVSGLLSDLLQNQARTHTRPHFEIKPKIESPEETLVELDLWGLVKTFTRLFKETTLDVPTSIIYDDVPLEEFIRTILELLTSQPVNQQGEQEICFSNLISDKPNYLDVIKNFLASLELVRQQKITVEQEKDFGEIRLKLRTDTESGTNIPPE